MLNLGELASLSRCKAMAAAVKGTASLLRLAGPSRAERRYSQQIARFVANLADCQGLWVFNVLCFSSRRLLGLLGAHWLARNLNWPYTFSKR